MHAREPWGKFRDLYTDGSHGPIMIKTLYGAGMDRSGLIPVKEMNDGVCAEDNADRIVACINGCEGIPTEELEAGILQELVDKTKTLLYWTSIHQSRPGSPIYKSLKQVQEVLDRIDRSSKI